MGGIAENGRQSSKQVPPPGMLVYPPVVTYRLTSGGAPLTTYRFKVDENKNT